MALKYPNMIIKTKSELPYSLVTPKSIYLTTLAVTVLCTRPLSGALD